MENNVTSIYKIGEGLATLILVNCSDVNDTIEFSIPTADMALKGANAIQNVGGLTTYTRRYLYMIAFEIAEDDEFDSVQKNEEKEEAPDPVIDDIKINVLRDEMNKKGVEESKIVARYKVKSLSELKTTQFMDAMKGLEATKTVENVDLGL